MFISSNILFMVNSNQSKGAEVAADCILCIYLLLTNADNMHATCMRGKRGLALP